MWGRRASLGEVIRAQKIGDEMEGDGHGSPTVSFSRESVKIKGSVIAGTYTH